MTQQLQFSSPVTRGWFALAQTALQAQSRRRPEFAQTEPAIFRSECFAEDLAPQERPSEVKPSRRAGWLAAAPLGLALVGAASALLVPLA